MAKQKENLDIRAKDHTSYWAYTLIALLFPFIGLILAIVMLTKDKLIDRKLGEHTLVCSIIGLILTVLFWMAVSAITYQPEPDILLGY